MMPRNAKKAVPVPFGFAEQYGILTPTNDRVCQPTHDEISQSNSNSVVLLLKSFSLIFQPLEVVYVFKH